MPRIQGKLLWERRSMETETELGADPIRLFLAWYEEAVAQGEVFADAMTVATVSADGRPSARMMLFKGVIDGGLSFFSNYRSPKGRDLELNPYAALVFHWRSLNRQVRVQGRVEKLSSAESDVYFRSRPRESQLGAWASPQSERVATRQQLDDRFAQVEQRFEGLEVDRPPFWGGYQLIPERFEFWIAREHRLHDRFLYERTPEGWKYTRLAP
jgi:pyridoxamine 5'-phosphate oxidase